MLPPPPRSTLFPYTTLFRSDVQLTHGIAETLQQLDKEPPEFRNQVAKFLDALVSHYVFDGGRLVVAHAGMKEEMQGDRKSTRLNSSHPSISYAVFCLKKKIN